MGCGGAYVCVSVCVRERQRKRNRERERQGQRQRVRVGREIHFKELAHWLLGAHKSKHPRIRRPELQEELVL